MGFIGLAGGDVRYVSGLESASSPTFSTASKKTIPVSVTTVTGANAKVLVNNAGNIVGALGNTTTGSGGGMFISTDIGVTYNATGLISTSNGGGPNGFGNIVYANYKTIDTNTMYLLFLDNVNGANAVGDHYMLMKTTNGGLAWSVILNYVNVTSQGNVVSLLGVYPSPLYSTDNTVYVPQSNNKVWISTNQGTTFTSTTAPGPGTIGPVMLAFAPKDGTTYYAAYNNDTVYKSGRSSGSAAYTTGGNPYSLLIAPNGDIIMGLDNGHVLKSVDDAATFTKVVTRC